MEERRGEKRKNKTGENTEIEKREKEVQSHQKETIPSKEPSLEKTGDQTIPHEEQEENPTKEKMDEESKMERRKYFSKGQ